MLIIAIVFAVMSSTTSVVNAQNTLNKNSSEEKIEDSIFAKYEFWLKEQEQKIKEFAETSDNDFQNWQNKTNKDRPRRQRQTNVVVNDSVAFKVCHHFGHIGKRLKKTGR